MEVDHYEWGTRIPSGNVISWDNESHARRAAVMSLTFPDGAHILVKRPIGSWSEVNTKETV